MTWEHQRKVAAGQSAGGTGDGHGRARGSIDDGTRTVTSVRNVWYALVAVLVVAGLAACGDVGNPVDLAKVRSAQRPMPQGVSGAEQGGGGSGPECGDPRASLRPSGLDTPPGSTMAEIKERGYLIAGVDQNSYLTGFRDPTTGNLAGFDIDIAREIAAALFGDRNAIQFRALTSAERVDALQQGDVDVVVRTMTITCERRQKINFSAEYLTAGQRVLVTKDSEAGSLRDLRGRKVCTSKGSTSLDRVVEADAQAVTVENWSDCLVLLQQGQVSAVSTDDTILAGMAAQDPNAELVGDRISTEPYGIGIPKDDEDMVRYVNAVLEKIIDDGTWQGYYQKWFSKLGNQSPPEPVYRD